MKIVTKSNEVGVITLKDLTDLISVRHDKSMIKVEELSKEPSFGSVSKIDIQYTSGKNTIQTIQTYLLNKKQAIAVGAKLNNSLLMKVIDKVDEIEKQNLTPQLPQNYIEALEALTVSEKDKILLTETIVKKDQVILDVADLNIKAGDVTISDFSKNLAIEGLGQNNLFSWLKGRGFLMMDTSPYQRYVERGYFVRKPNGSFKGEVRYRTLLTPKGTVWLTRMLKAEYDLD